MEDGRAQGILPSINDMSGDDVIVGTKFADRILGGAGNDTLTGGSGNDILTGDIGDDTFHFEAGFGKDTVTDFKSSTDTHNIVEFAQGMFADFADVMAHAAGAACSL
jgi:Ca2+-binding RTX toxin-like protein